MLNEAALGFFSEKDKITIRHTPASDPNPWISINAPIGHEFQGQIANAGVVLEWVFKYKYGSKNIGSAMGCDNSFHVPPENFEEVLELTENILRSMWGKEAEVVIEQLVPKVD